MADGWLPGPYPDGGFYSGVSVQLTDVTPVAFRYVGPDWKLIAEGKFWRYFKKVEDGEEED